MKGHAVAIPILLKAESQPQPSSAQSALFAAPQAKLSTRANLSKRARAYLEHLNAPDPDGNLPSAKLLWLHALAVGYSPRYRLENADGIRSDYPRIPLPGSLERLQASATLGSRIADLLDGEKPSFPESVKGAGKLSRKGGGQLSSADLEVTASWGNPTKTGVMPGRGLLERRAEGAGEVVDVYLNAVAYWADVPSSVWNYTIGGYQVLKKWLSYRDARVLKRALTNEEAREFSSTVKRLAALVALEDDLDANYGAVLEGVWSWSEEIPTTPQKTTADTSR